MSEVICNKCKNVLPFGLEFHWHCYIRDCNFICNKPHNHPFEGGFCGSWTCGTYHEHCIKCGKVHNEKDGEIYGLCNHCEEAENKKSS